MRERKKQRGKRGNVKRDEEVRNGEGRREYVEEEKWEEENRRNGKVETEG